MQGLNAEDEPISGTDRSKLLLLIYMFQGAINHLKVEGVMIVKNFLQGHPMLKIAVNEDLQICKPGDIRGMSAIPRG